MKYAPEIETEILELEEVDVETIKLYAIVVFNDDVNSFDHVIDTLIDVCEHSTEQAEQCTLIIHFKGKCAVKNGDFDELTPMRNAICERGISAEILLR
jgi:ATP-dependent Clp protease adaptor protein ClpS